MSIFDLAPYLNDEQCCVAEKQSIRSETPLSFESKLTVGDGEEVMFLVWTNEVAQVATRVFWYPNGVVVGSEERREVRLARAFGSYNGDLQQVVFVFLHPVMD